MDILQIKGLYKDFKDKSVLKGLSLTVPEHSIYGFIGRNGSGKTTTMKAVIGMLRPDSGEIYVCGKRVKYGQTETNKYIGYLPDVPEYYGYMTAMEYLTLCGDVSGLPAHEVNRRAERLLALVGLSDQTHRIKGFSRGMKQRLGIAQALLGKPKLLICDEPTSALDPVGRKEILDVLKAAASETTVLFSTHILTDVERICTDAAFLHDGKIVLQGKIGELKAINRTREFLVEASEDAVNALLAAYPCGKAKSAQTAVFCDDDVQMNEVLRYIAEQNLTVERVERNDPNLEALFLEVTEQ